MSNTRNKAWQLMSYCLFHLKLPRGLSTQHDCSRHPKTVQFISMHRDSKIWRGHFILCPRSKKVRGRHLCPPATYAHGGSIASLLSPSVSFPFIFFHHSTPIHPFSVPCPLSRYPMTSSVLHFVPKLIFPPILLTIDCW